MLDFFITANGPGEISTWVLPVVKRLREEFTQCRITLFILPCRFSTGTEAEYANQIPEIDYVFQSREFFKRLRSLPIKPYKNGLVIYLGGDAIWAILLKLRYRFKAIAYSETQYPLLKYFNTVFLRKRDGDLMLESLAMTIVDQKLIQTLKLKKTIVFFPGSRPSQFQYLFPLFQEVAKTLPQGFLPVFNISPFIPEAMVASLTQSKWEKSIYRDKTHELMQSCYLAISIPGTNNVQLAYWNAPSLIIFPFNFPDVVQFKGIIGAILNIPGLRKPGKKILLSFLDKRVKFTSLVNANEGREIFPELRGNLSVQVISEFINKYLDDSIKIVAIRENLKGMVKKTRILDNMIHTIRRLL